MPTKGSKTFSLLSAALEALADGARRHGSDEGFPPFLSEQEIRKLRDSFEAKRHEYERLQAQADQAFKAYKEMVVEVKDRLGRAQRFLQGLYGLRSEVLKDFGFKPPKPGGRKGKKKASEASAS